MISANKNKVKETSIILAINIVDEKLYKRKYYKVEYFNSEVLIFLTTNEPDSDWKERILDSDFQWIPNFDSLVNEIENSKFLNILINGRFNSPPKYIYYNIEFIDNSIKTHFLNHLKENISGFTDIDLTNFELIQIEKWLNYLNS